MMKASENNLLKVEHVDKCPLCNAETSLLYSDLKDRLFGVKGTFSIRKCMNPECTAWHLDPMPLDDEIWKCYQTYYTHAKVKSDKSKFLSVITKLICKFLMSRYESVIGLKKEHRALRYMGIKDRAKGRLLEIGCGDGRLLSLFKELGWTVEGIETDETSAEAANKLTGATIFHDPIDKLNLDSSKYDVIIMHHSLEHFKYPKKVLSESYRVLKKGGILALATPNCEGYESKIFGYYWFALEPPRHLVLYNHKSLNKLARDAGFNNITIKPKLCNQRWAFETSEEVLTKGNCMHLYNGGISSPKSIIKSVFHQIRHIRAARIDPQIGNELYMWCEK